MINFFIETLLLALCCGTIAAVYKGWLAYEPVLNWWFRFGNKYETRWFFNPVWGCVKCIAGQLALWFYLFIEIMPAMFTERGQISTVGVPSLYFIANPIAWLFGLIWTICAAMLISCIIHFFILRVLNK